MPVKIDAAVGDVIWVGLQKIGLNGSCMTSTSDASACDGILEWTEDSEAFTFASWMQVGFNVKKLNYALVDFFSDFVHTGISSFLIRHM